MGVNKCIIKFSSSDYHNRWVYYILDRYYKRYNAFIDMGYSCNMAQKMACFKFTERYFTLNKQAEPFNEKDMSTFNSFIRANSKKSRLQKFVDGEDVLTDFSKLSPNLKHKYYDKFKQRSENKGYQNFVLGE